MTSKRVNLSFPHSPGTKTEPLVLPTMSSQLHHLLPVHRPGPPIKRTSSAENHYTAQPNTRAPIQYSGSFIWACRWAWRCLYWSQGGSGRGWQGIGAGWMDDAPRKDVCLVVGKNLQCAVVLSKYKAKYNTRSGLKFHLTGDHHLFLLLD